VPGWKTTISDLVKHSLVSCHGRKSKFWRFFVDEISRNCLNFCQRNRSTFFSRVAEKNRAKQRHLAAKSRNSRNNLESWKFDENQISRNSFCTKISRKLPKIQHENHTIYNQNTFALNMFQSVCQCLFLEWFKPLYEARF
jgi:replicative DNA helicase